MSVPTDTGTEYLGDGMVLPKGYLAKGEKTFQHQDSLPAMPVPDLNDTLRRYLSSVEPHLSPADLQKTRAIVDAFSNGVGKDLQEKLQEKAKTSRNWIETWWEDYAYLLNREPHIPYVNFAGPGPYTRSFWPAKPGTQCERAGLVLWFAMKYWQLLRQERIAVDRGGRSTLWCMNQYRKMFNGCKTPGHTLDKLNSWFKTESEGPCPSHMVVVRRGRYYNLPMMHPDGSVLTPPEISAQLEDIIRQSDRLGPGADLGYLTTENRTTWAKLRDHLISLHPDNQRHLWDIQTSVILVALEDSSPSDMQQLGVEGLIGDPSYRWYDKPVQFIFFSNGTMTSNGDHAPYEAMVPLYLNLFTLLGVEMNDGRWKHATYDAIIPVMMLYFTYACVEANNMTWKGRRDIRPLSSPRELDFHLDSVINQAVEQAKHHFTVTGSSVELHIDFFEDFGKSYIRKHKMHPDTLMQMAIQIAYYRQYNRPAPTYETASARKFYHGRTETVRACTNETLALAKAVLDPATTTKQKMTLLMAAMQNHLSLMKDATEIKACDRHLFGLQLTALEAGLPVPEIFTDPAYTKSGGGGNYILSTSFVGFTPCFGGVAPMCRNGYGVFYSIMNDRINLFISSWRADEETNGPELYANIRRSLRDLRAVIDAGATTNKL